jgi:hypothetical protein
VVGGVCECENLGGGAGITIYQFEMFYLMYKHRQEILAFRKNTTIINKNYKVINIINLTYNAFCHKFV